MRLRDVRPEIALAVATLVLCAALAFHGARFHPMEVVGGAEQDGYVAQAARVLAGEMPRDPLRPPLYPLLVAATASLGIDPFAAARLVSNLASAGLAALAWGFGRRFGDLSSAWLAFALAAAHPFVWTTGQTAATDPLFAMFGALAWLAALAWLERPERGTALAAGAALGFAALTRGNALFLVPGFFLLPAFAARRREGERPFPRRDLAWAAALCFALVAPLLWLRYRQFGDPLHDENWRNLAFKLFGRGDWSYLSRTPFDGVAGVIGADPGRFVRAGVDELRVLVVGGAGWLFGRIPVALIAAAGFGLAWVAKRRLALWLAVAGLLYGGLLAFAFFAWTRFLAILLPPALGFLALPAGAPGRRLLERALPDRAAGRSAILAATALLLLGSFAVRTTLQALPRFAAAHPLAEARELRGLAARVPPGAVLGGTSSVLARQLPSSRFVPMPDPTPEEAARTELYLERLRRLVEKESVGWLVVGPVGLGRRPTSLLAERSPVDWLVPDGGDGSARIWRVTFPSGSEGTGPAGG